MTLLTAGCSFSSGWGFDHSSMTWTHQIAQKLELQLDNVAQTSASNADIFLSTIKGLGRGHDLVLVQWTALNRITVSSSPVNPRVILSYHDRYLEDALPELDAKDIRSFTKVLSKLNQDWKPFFDLVDMIEILQKDPRVYFINGLLPWDQEFFAQDWKIPLDHSNAFLESLLQVNDFDDMVLQNLLNKVLSARQRIDQTRWINLTNSWESCKLDTISSTDPHPGLKSQTRYVEQIYNFIKENHA